MTSFINILEEKPKMSNSNHIKFLTIYLFTPYVVNTENIELRVIGTVNEIMLH